LKKNKLHWLTRAGNGVAYSIQAPGPHGPGYRLAGSPVSCRQLEADASTIISSKDTSGDTVASHSLKSNCCD